MTTSIRICKNVAILASKLVDVCEIGQTCTTVNRIRYWPYRKTYSLTKRTTTFKSGQRHRSERCQIVHRSRRWTSIRMCQKCSPPWKQVCACWRNGQTCTTVDAFYTEEKVYYVLLNSGRLWRMSCVVVWIWFAEQPILNKYFYTTPDSDIDQDERVQ